MVLRSASDYVSQSPRSEQLLHFHVRVGVRRDVKPSTSTKLTASELQVNLVETQILIFKSDLFTMGSSKMMKAAFINWLSRPVLAVTLLQMQRVGAACRLDDDMVEGDLGDGMRVVAVPSSAGRKKPSVAALCESLPLRAELRRRSSRPGEAAWIPALNTAETQEAAQWKIPHFSSLADWSKEKLKEKLQEAAEVIDDLCCELDVTHRYLKGKYEALKILQGKAILDKATSHTQSLLQKSEEKAKALEKEVNSLQWELSFLQLQMKKSEQSWELRYNRIASENKTLADKLEERDAKIQPLCAENYALKRQYLELLSMLDVRGQRIYQGTKPQYSPERDASVLELAVLGACRCLGVTEACACSRTAAASRKQLLQLQQELDAQHLKREEALMVADAFRIAFEQQLRKRSEHLLLLTEANILKPHHAKPQGVLRSPLTGVGEKLRGLLPSSLDMKMPEELLQTLYRLLDLLNDKEEALAHQRKVSIMLAHSAEELQKQLHVEPPPEPSTTCSKQGQDPSENRSQLTSHPSKSNMRGSSESNSPTQLDPPQPGPPPDQSECGGEVMEPTDTPQANSQHQSATCHMQQSQLSES